MNITQEDKDKDPQVPISLNFTMGELHWKVDGPGLLPMSFWLDTALSYEELYAAVNILGPGLPFNRVARNLIYYFNRHQGFHYGVTLAENPDGGRFFLSFGLDRLKMDSLILGFDVPCSLIDKYAVASPETAAGSYDQWAIIKLQTEDKMLCRLPMVIFHPVSGPR